MTVARVFALIFGAIYVIAGVAGFIRPLTNAEPDGVIVTQTTDLLGIFAVNWFHNLAHLIIGVLGLIAAARTEWGRLYSQVVGVVYAVLFIIGIFVVDREFLGILPLDWPDNVLHLVSAVLALVVGFTPVGLQELAARRRAVA